MMRLLVTRPADDAEELCEVLRARGHSVILSPTMRIVTLPHTALELDGVQALLATSANGVRGLARSNAPRDLPLFAVGDATAKAARQTGFASVRSAGGDVEDLVRLVRESLQPEGGALLHAAGRDVAGDLAGRLEAAGFAVRRAVLYRAEPAGAFEPDAAEALTAKALDGVLLYSPRTAKLFLELARPFGPETLRRLTAYCLSEAVAEVARKGGFGRCEAAARPDQESLLDLLPAGRSA